MKPGELSGSVLDRAALTKANELEPCCRCRSATTCEAQGLLQHERHAFRLHDEALARFGWLEVISAQLANSVLCVRLRCSRFSSNTKR